MLDRLNPKAMVLLVVVFAAIVCALILGGCKGPDAAARTLATFEIAYTDGSGTIDGAHAGSIDQPGYVPDSPYAGSSSSDADWHAWTFSISPLAAMHDPHAATREVIESQYQLMLARDDRERAEADLARAKLLPFVESSPGADAPEPVSSSDAGKGGSAPAPDLPWWKDTALLIGYATVIGSVLAGLVMGWKRVHPAKE